MALTFQRDFEPNYGTLVQVAPGVRRLTAENPTPFTFKGTNSYIIGEGEVALVDPGPNVTGHIAALRALHSREKITRIIVTHSHRDHTEGLPAIRAATGAPVYAAGGRLAPAVHADRGPRLDAGADETFKPDVAVRDGETIAGDGWALEAIATPGHASDHICFAIAGTDMLISGDHVMGWSTTIVSPPDGNMQDYMNSLDRMLKRLETVYLPGHGEKLTDPKSYVSGLKTHRKMREAAIAKRLELGDRTIPEIVAAIYKDTDVKLHRAAGQSVRAHLEDMIARGLVVADAASPDERFTLR